MLYDTGSSTWYSVMTLRSGMGSRKEAQEGGTIYTLRADSCHMAETNTTLYSNDSPIKKKKNLKWQQAHKDSAKYQNWSTVWKKARVGWSERIALKHVYYHIWNRLPVQVWCMRQGAQGWCTGLTKSNGMGRGVRGVSGWKKHVNPWLIHVNVWQKPLQYCKVIRLQLK